uniref:Uncharacterized protein n=1 Tax=Coccolithus braarudii TaxID=221442 RepID=A0A7S0LLL5_9EUKA|mmetsp:Transcript_47203/g.100739  ORF Transcript_47203/g.100739 Transcript_47203/m.100739 type:complete len:170 (+) Transcript_47203:395-904(+)
MLQAMLALADAKKRAKTANETALAAEKAKDAAQSEVDALERILNPKKARTEPAAEAADDEGTTAETEDWDLADHRREETRVRNRRAVELRLCESVRELRTGKLGYLHHARLGLLWVLFPIGHLGPWVWLSSCLLQGVEQDVDLIRYVFNPEMDEQARDTCIACGAVTPT